MKKFRYGDKVNYTFQGITVNAKVIYVNSGSNHVEVRQTNALNPWRGFVHRDSLTPGHVDCYPEIPKNAEVYESIHPLTGRRSCEIGVYDKEYNS